MILKQMPNVCVNVRDVISRGKATASSTVPPQTNRGENGHEGEQHHNRRHPDISYRSDIAGSLGVCVYRKAV